MTAPAIAILGTPGHVRDPARFDDEALLRILGANAGNLVFQHAASQIVDAPQLHFGMSETPYADTDALRAAQALVFPAANHLRPGADWTGLCGYLANLRIPLVVLGLGAQSPTLGGSRETIEALRSDDNVMRLVAVLREKAAFVSVRGAYSQTVCEELGLPGTEPLGCPSALLNPDPEAGATMAARLARLRERLAADPAAPVRMALAAAAPFEIYNDPDRRDLERRLVAWTMAAGGMYVQQSGGVVSMLAAGSRWHEVEPGARRSIAATLAPGADPVDFWAFMAGCGRFFLSAPDWREAMRGRDLVIGTRLHGNMAAIAAGTPGVVIAHDSRTGELRRTMHLPHLPMTAAMAAPSLAAALDRVEFDGAAFDAWRGRTAAALARAFDRLDIPVSAQVRALARRAAGGTPSGAPNGTPTGAPT